MNKTPIIGAGTDFTINSNGYIASFLTDANDPSLLVIPAGNWNFEIYFEASSGGGSPTFYLELYKYDGTTFTLVASNSGTPKLINDGTSIEAYFSALAVPQTTLTLTDRLAIRIYVTTAGRTITLHTENGHLCQVITTFTTGLSALNGLTSQVQFFAVGTSGTNFNIASASDTHTFNLPTASATNRGALASADWSTFNNKQNQLNGTGFVKASGTTITYDNSTYQVTSEKGQPNGYASLDSNGKVPLAQINDALIGNVNYQGLWNAATNTPTLANPPSSGTKGYYYIVSTAGTFASISFEVGDWIISNGSAWQKVDNTDAVSSVFGRTGNVIAANGDYNTSQVTENTNLYFTNARVLATALTGYTLGTNTALAATDTILGAFEKVQGQLNAKQNTLTNPITGTGTNNFLPRFTGSTTIGNSTIQTDGSGNLMVGSADAGDAGSINVSVGIAGSTSGGLQLWSSNLATHYIQFGDGTTGEQKYAGYVGYSHSTNAMVFGTDSGNKMRIFSDGNVSISNFPSNGGFKLDVNGTGRFISNLTAASFIRSGGTSSQFLKADGSVDSNTYVTGGPYLPLTGGTLTGTLNGTTAVFSNTVTGYQGIFKDGSDGLIIGYYTGGNGYGAIYASSLTINNSNYALIAKSDNTILNAPTGGSVNVSIGNTPRLTIASTGAATFSSSVTITDGGYYIYDTRTNLANRNWVLVSNAQFFGDFAIRQSNAKDGNPLTAGTDRFYIGPTGAATFSSSVTATSIIRSGGTSSQYLMADGSVSTLTNPVTGTGTAGQVAYWSSGSAITGESNLFWDATNDRLGIGIATPAQRLDVNGVAQFRDDIRFTTSNSSIGYTDSLRFFELGVATRMTLSSGNLGLGVTPSAWGSSNKVYEATFSTSMVGRSDLSAWGRNFFYNSSDAGIYANNGHATGYFQTSGQHFWVIAPSGTAGNAISFTQAMTLGSNSGLSIGTPSAAPSQGLLVQGNVGIGVGPVLKLDVQGNAADTTTVGGVTVEQVTLFRPSNGVGGIRSGFNTSTGDAYLWSAQSSGNLYLGTRVAPNNNVNVAILSSGNVGIGTASPSGGLEVSRFGTYSYFSSNANATFPANVQGISLGWNSSGGGGESIIAYNKGGGSTGGLVFANNDGGSYSEKMRITSGGDVIVGYNQTTTTTIGRTFATTHASVNRGATLFYGINDGSNGGMFSYNVASSVAGYNSQYITFETHEGAVSAGERMRITSTGNVGIGTASPAQRLSVNGGVYVASFVGSTTPYITVGTAASGADNRLEIVYNAAGNYGSLGISGYDGIFTVKPNAIGIGTNSPNYLLHIAAGAANPQLQFTSTGTGSTTSDGFHIGVNNSTLNAFLLQKENADLQILTNDSERMRITSGGNVGIGTASPNQRIEVNGRIRVSTNGTNGGDMGVDDGGIAFSTQGATPISFWRNNYANHSMQITSGGNVLIGTTTDAGYKLDVNGTGRFSGRLTISNTIDAYAEITTSSAGADSLLGFSNTGDANSSWGIGRRNTGEFWIANYTGNFNSGTRTVPFQIASTGAATFSSSVTAGSFVPTSSTVPTNGMYLDSANTIAFSTNGSQKLILTSVGDILFRGQETGDLSGARIINNSNALAFYASNLTSGPAKSISFYGRYLADELRMRISVNGNVLIGTDTDTSDKLRVGGNTFTNTITTYRPGVNTIKSDAWKLGRASAGTQPTEDHQITVQIGDDLYAIGAVKL
jgi:hypothetical protein